jgi:hypothetical protein
VQKHRLHKHWLPHLLRQWLDQLAEALLLLLLQGTLQYLHSAAAAMLLGRCST